MSYSDIFSDHIFELKSIWPDIQLFEQLEFLFLPRLFIFLLVNDTIVHLETSIVLFLVIFTWFCYLTYLCFINMTYGIASSFSVNS